MRLADPDTYFTDVFPVDQRWRFEKGVVSFTVERHVSGWWEGDKRYTVAAEEFVLRKNDERCPRSI